MRKAEFGPFMTGLSIKQRLKSFAEDELGATMTFLVLVWMVLIMFFAAMAIDFTRAEHMRVRIQATLDRAVLAASDIDQQLAPSAVILDYFAKAGLAGYIKPEDIIVTPDVPAATRVSSREVKATARGVLDTSLLEWHGIYSLGAPGVAGAKEESAEVEVVLVLDVSGSMGNDGKLQDMKDAVSEFVTMILTDPNSAGKVSVAIVNYAAQVNVGSVLRSKYLTDGTNPFAKCIDFTTADFSRVDVSRTTVLADADFFDRDTQHNASTGRAAIRFHCPGEETRRIFPFTDNLNDLTTNIIPNLTAQGNTSMEIGMKWGSHMLDPSFRPIMNELIAEGRVPASMAGRPFNYVEPNVVVKKYVILMSDGKNTDQNFLRPGFDVGLSNIWYDPGSDTYSAFHPSMRPTQSEKYWVARSSGAGWSNQPEGGSNAIRKTWPEVFNELSLRWVAHYLYGTPRRNVDTSRSLGNWRDYYVGQMMDAIRPNEKNLRTRAICDALKGANGGNNNIVIHAINFQAPPEGQAELQYCATPGDYLNANNGEQLTGAFRQIARRITELKLTQ